MTNKHIELPALSPNDHPDNHVMQWSPCEMRAIQAYARAAIAAHEQARVVGDPVASDAFTKALSIRAAQGWELTGKAVPVLYTDAINGEQVCRDDLWICTTAALASPVAQPATEQAEAPNPLADYHRDQYEHAFNGWEACKQECDRLRDELEEATQPTASNAGDLEITRYHRALAGMQPSISGDWVTYDDHRAALSATTPAPVGQDKEDAERLQWLFDNAGCICVKDSQWQLWFDLPDVCYGNPPTELRSAIDAARAARGDEVNQK